MVKAVAGGDLLGLADGTLGLPHGRIMVAGSFRASRFSQGVTFAVVGGTGAYRHAQGTMDVRNGRLNGHSGQYLTIDLG